MTYELGEPRRSWISKGNDTDMSVHVAIRGTIPLHDLLAYLAERGVDTEGVTINFSTIHWVAPATNEEIEDRREHDRRAEERQAEWERGMWVKLQAKFGNGQP